MLSSVESRHREITEIRKHHNSVNINVRALNFFVCLPSMLSSLLVIFQLDPFAIKFATGICARTRSKIFTVYHYQLREVHAFSGVER